MRKNLSINIGIASELRKLAKDMGISKIGKLRKDELEKIILKYLRKGKLHISKEHKQKDHSLKDTLSLNSYIKNYKNDKENWYFINKEVKKIQPNFKEKSGAKYWLNRWREEQIKKGNEITYFDLIKKYIKLSNVNRLPQIPSAKFNNFITAFLRDKKFGSRTDCNKSMGKIKKNGFAQRL